MAIEMFGLDSMRFAKWSLSMFGTWQIRNDGIQTNGGGIVGDAIQAFPGNTFAKAFDASEGAGTWGNLNVTGARGGYAVNFQLFPTLPLQTDAIAFGATVKYCEIAWNLSATLAVYATDTLVWEYSDGVGSWAALTVNFDNTDTTASDGLRSFQQDGALHFIPPDDWASVEVDAAAPVTAYWIRAIMDTGKDITDMTTVPLMQPPNSHFVVSPGDGFICPHDGIITDIRLIDQATTLHTTSNVVFILMNFTTGEHSGAAGAGHTFAQDQRQDSYSGLSLEVNQGDELGVLVTEEDTNNDDPTGVMLELSVTRT